MSLSANRSKLLLAAVGLCLCQLATTAMADDKPSVTLYRYINDQGTRVTSNKIPPQYAKKGYQVVTMSGAVLEDVAPEPTAEERKQYELKEQQKITEAQQQEYDKKLLLRYDTLNDIRKAKERKLLEIDGNIKILQGNIAGYHQQQDTEKAKAVSFERNGNPVPAAIQQKIHDTANDIEVSENKLKASQEDRAKEEQQFDSDMQRFQQLKPEAGK